MNNLRDEIKDVIEFHTDEWVPSYVMAYGPDHAVVIWDSGYRTEFTWQEYSECGQMKWDARREDVYEVGGFDIECVFVDGEVDEYSLEMEGNRLEFVPDEY